jgi:hypothetical protein
MVEDLDQDQTGEDPERHAFTAAEMVERAARGRGPRRSYRSSPSARARVTAWVRLAAPSLSRMWVT